MSIQTYNKPIYYGDRLIGPNDEVAELTAKNGVAMEFAVRVQTTRGHDVMATRETTFTIVGNAENGISGDTGNATALYALIEAGSRMAANIASMSKGRISGFYAKLGKFRDDEQCIDVASGDNSFASVLLTNNPNDALGVNPCDKTETYPTEKAGAKIFIPWLKDNVSRQDIMTTLADWEYVQDGITFTLGTVKFKDDNQVDMVAYPALSCQSISVKDYSRSTARLKQNNDSALGIRSDKVLSEKFNDFQSGIDD